MSDEFTTRADWNLYTFLISPPWLKNYHRGSVHIIVSRDFSLGLAGSPWEQGWFSTVFPHDVTVAILHGGHAYSLLVNQVNAVESLATYFHFKGVG